jgi:ABC-type molybdate transport system substrate-binding protein
MTCLPAADRLHFFRACVSGIYDCILPFHHAQRVESWAGSPLHQHRSRRRWLCRVNSTEATAFAAASLKAAMGEQAKRSAASPGSRVTVSYGARNAVAKQIEAAAPADIFISAAAKGIA